MTDPKASTSKNSNNSRIAIILSDKAPTWVSSRTIRSNLLKAYQQAFPASEFFAFNPNASGTTQLVESLKKYKPTKVVFLESVPNPLGVISLMAKPAVFKQTEFCFHIYGDFSLYTPEWHEVFRILQGRPCKIVLASGAQRGQVSEFFRSEAYTKNLDLCPFPIDRSLFHPAPNRDEIRANLNLSKDDFVIVYSGRVSTQKGFPLTIDWLDQFAKKNKIKNFKFLIPGSFDDAGTPLWGERHPHGLSFAVFQHSLRQLSPYLKDRVIYLGDKTSAELFQIYNAADLYLSLSSYHDEDYGMAPLECIFCGAPALLSSWGGFNSFRITKKDVHYVRSKIGSQSIELNHSDFDNELLSLYKSWKEDASERQSRHERYNKKFSIEAIAGLVLKMHDKKFSALTATKGLFEFHASLIQKHRTQQTPLYNSASKQDKLYHLLYNHYCTGR